jgi:hypothetical protein
MADGVVPNNGGSGKDLLVDLLRGNQRGWSQMKHETERGRSDPESVPKTHWFDGLNAKMAADF